MGNLHILHRNYSFCSKDKITICLANFFFPKWEIATWLGHSGYNPSHQSPTAQHFWLCLFPNRTWLESSSQGQFLSRKRNFNRNFSWSYKKNHWMVKQKSHKIHLGRIFSPSSLWRQFERKEGEEWKLSRTTHPG